MNPKQKGLIVLVIVLALVVTACQPQPVDPVQPSPEALPTEPVPSPIGQKPGDFLISNVERVSAPEVTLDDQQTLSAGNTAFALELYQQLRQMDEGNLFYSPYSISITLAMTLAGARGETESQMADALNFGLEQARLHPAFNALDQQLQTTAQMEDEPPFRLNIANSLWGQKDYPFLAEFLDTLARNYGAGMNIVDYGQPEQARKIINDWVAGQTEDKIQDLIPEGALDTLTRLVLTNAIYFNATWTFPFDPGATRPGDFTLLDNSVIQAPMMHLSENLAYLKGENYQVVELPYYNSPISMLVFLPDDGEFEVFEGNLDANLLDEIRVGMHSTQVELSLPKFKFESDFNLSDPLKAMGMADAFDHELADFSGMTGVRELYITDVVHKAYVDVNEEGTEAAAATGVVVGVVSMPADQVTLRVDRPFVFMIVDRISGTVLFVGRVLDPR